MVDLFEHQADQNPSAAPLAERMRPKSLKEVVGQTHLLAADSALMRALSQKQLPSMILWGPPGSGKTTLARLLAQALDARFAALSAVMSNLSELRKVLEEARRQKVERSVETLLFIDEIHRFHKGQQDALLPYVEKGYVTLIGATTENPSFSVIRPLISRSRVFRLHELTVEELLPILQRALKDQERGLNGIDADEKALRVIAEMAEGDARRALNALEFAAQTAIAGGRQKLTLEDARAAAESTALGHDRAGDAHYDVVSAFIKSMRGSDPDAAIYWMMRMLEGGESPAFVTRRMMIFASEDIGNADPQALLIAVAADQAFHRLGMPESTHVLAQCCLYLASAPKSNASYRAWLDAQEDVRTKGALPVPLKLRNAVTAVMKAEGYAKDYRYPHSEGGFAVGEEYLPEKLGHRRYYQPTPHGFEEVIAKRLQHLRSKT